MLHCGIGSLHPPAQIRGGRRRRRHHQAQALQQHDRPLRRCPPHKLATFSLAVLHVDVTAGIFQAAILKGAIDENPVIQHQVLILEDLVFVSSHEKTRLPPASPGCKLRLDLKSAPRSRTQLLQRGLAAAWRTRGTTTMPVRRTYLWGVSTEP